MTKEEQYDPLKKVPAGKNLLEVIGDLLKEKGISRFAKITSDWEGNTLPGGIPYESAQILTEDGKVFYFWLDWDPDKEPPADMKAKGVKGWYTLGENFKDPQTGEHYPMFREILPSDEGYPKPNNTAFLGAKRKLGLPLDEQEINILRERWKNLPEMLRELKLE